MHDIVRRFAIFFATAVLFAPKLGLAHAAHDEPAAQNAALLSSVILLGGGADRFSAGEFRRALSASSPDEDRKLRGDVGAAMVDRFDNVFSYVVRDGAATMKRTGKPLPPPATTNAKAVAIALYEAGLHDGAFEVERVFDVLFSPAVHSHAMVAVARKYGADGETAYHTVFAHLVQDLGKS